MLAKTREAACLDATKGTIDKLNMLVMRKYESYSTRRIPMDLSSLKLAPKQYATLRMQALRDLMRMEMPERACDVIKGPVVLPKSPSLQVLYQAKNSAAGTPLQSVKDHVQAKCLFMWVMNAIPEAKTMFSGSEIGVNFDGDGWNVFLDGWGNPIGFLRWAPGATVTLNAAGTQIPGPNGQIGWSDVQIDDTQVQSTQPNSNLHHDPFDPNFVEATAYHLYPLIFAGVLGKTSGVDDYGIALGNGVISGDCSVTAPTVDPFIAPYAGTPPVGAALSTGGAPLVHNHHMEQK